MTLPMLATLRTESVRIHLELYRRGKETSEEGGLSVLRKNGTYYPAPYQFVYLRVRLANLSCKSPTPIYLMMTRADRRV